MKTAVRVILFIFISFSAKAQQTQWEMVTSISSETVFEVKSSPTGNVFVRQNIIPGAPFYSLKKSTDIGITWQTLQNISPTRLMIPQNGSLFITQSGSGATNIYRSTDDGNAWTKQTNNDPELGATVLYFDNPKGYFIQGFYNGHQPGPTGMIFSTDDGESWRTAYSQPSVGFQNIILKAFTISKDIIYCANIPYSTYTNNSLFYSLDNSTMFRPKTLPAPDVNCLYSSPISNDIYEISSSDGVYYSKDTGKTWVERNNGLRKTIVSFKVDVKGHFYAGTDKGLFVSSNNGENWNLISADDLNIKDILFRDSSIVLINTNKGILLSKNSGESWITMNNNLPDLNLTSLTINKQGYAFVVSNSKLFRSSTSLENITHTEMSQDISGFTLDQNYPNPFNPSTYINYQLPEAGFVSLKIYDLLGNEVATLVNEYKAKGSYNIKFNASNCASGVYIYRLKAGNYNLSKKMSLIK